MKCDDDGWPLPVTSKFLCRPLFFYIYLYTENNKLKNLSDTSLIRAIRNGKTEAFDTLFNRYWERLYIAAYARLGNEEEAKDCVQELFYTLWEKKEEINEIENISAYLFVALRNRIYNIYRSRQVRDKYLYFLSENKKALRKEDTGNLLEIKELEEQIEKEVQMLPPKMQAIFRMSREQGMSIEQIAEELSLSPQTVKNQISTALKRLRVKLDGFT